jgi:hypothetical protein
MAILIENLDEAMEEAKRFLKRAHELKDTHAETRFNSYHCEPKLQAAVKRSSMDLSRALSKLRQGD